MVYRRCPVESERHAVRATRRHSPHGLTTQRPQFLLCSSPNPPPTHRRWLVCVNVCNPHCNESLRRCWNCGFGLLHCPTCQNPGDHVASTVGAVQNFFRRVHLRALQPSSARSLQPPGLTSLHWPGVGRFTNTATQKPALVHNHSHDTTHGWSGSSVGENQGTMPPVISLNFDAPSANLDVISRIDLWSSQLKAS